MLKMAMPGNKRGEMVKILNGKWHICEAASFDRYNIQIRNQPNIKFLRMRRTVVQLHRGCETLIITPALCYNAWATLLGGAGTGGKEGEMEGKCRFALVLAASSYHIICSRLGGGFV